MQRQFFRLVFALLRTKFPELEFEHGVYCKAEEPQTEEKRNGDAT